MIATIQLDPRPAAAPSDGADGSGGLSFADIVAVARDGARVELTEAALDALAAGRATVDRLAAAPTPAYGISTGFGALATRHIDPESRAALQRSLIRSHAAGMGEPVEPEVVRALMLMRLKTLASGHTGVRPVVAETMAALLNSGITPAVREYGSLGCSGDLAPLSHVALVLMGEGEVIDDAGKAVDAAPVLAAHGITPLQLEPKEGLALINGTDGMLGMLILALRDFQQLLKLADLTAAMSVEALLGTDRVFRPELHTIRPHPGQAASAANLLRLLEDSGVVASHRGPDCNRVQDAYSLRCAPQVAGAARDTLAHVVGDTPFLFAKNGCRGQVHAAAIGRPGALVVPGSVPPEDIAAPQYVRTPDDVEADATSAPDNVVAGGAAGAPDDIVDEHVAIAIPGQGRTGGIGACGHGTGQGRRDIEIAGSVGAGIVVAGRVGPLVCRDHQARFDGIGREARIGLKHQCCRSGYYRSRHRRARETEVLR